MNHPIKKCFVFKNKIIALANQGMITFDEHSMVSNIIAIVSDSFDQPIVEVKFNSILAIKINAEYPFPMIIGESLMKNK